MEDDYVRIYDVTSQAQGKYAEARMSKGNCRESTFIQQQYYRDYQDARENTQQNEDVINSSIEVDDCYKNIARMHLKKCLIIVAVSVSVMVILMTIAAFVLAALSYSHSTNDEFANEIDFIGIQVQELKNKTQDSEGKITSNVNSLINRQHQELASATQNNISQVYTHLQNDVTSLQLQIYCGTGQWYRVAFLNMSDPSQQCPSAWRMFNTKSVRACGRTDTSSASCPGVLYSTGREYRRVCGRIVGYQLNSSDGFNDMNSSIDAAYMDGVSVTLSKIPPQHIWSYVAGVTERSTMHTMYNCPCSIAAGSGPQPFVGNNYYCESGNPTDSVYSVFIEDKLWDGQQCEGTCCSDIKNPPWFSVYLSNSTTDSIEVRICGNEGTDNENTPIELLEIYVQ